MKYHAEYRRELRSYLIGAMLAAILCATAFAGVALSDLSRSTLLWIIASTAIVQIIVHFRFFLHIDLARSRRDDLQLILFSTLIVVLMAGGTIWILWNLHTRMM